jgi:hypothetical protein
MTPWQNTAAAFLNIGCQPDREDDLPSFGWGVALPQWQEYPDTVVLMHKDKKPLLREHVAALPHFCGRYLASKSQPQMAPGSCLGKGYVLKEVTKEKFEEYSEKWKWVQTDPEARRCISPYEI